MAQQTFLCKICEANIGKVLDPDQQLQQPGTSAADDVKIRCALCFGLLDDGELLEQIATEVAQKLSRDAYEAVSFVLALNLPMSCLLRETVAEQLVGPTWAPMSMSPKELLSRELMAKIHKTTGLRPSLNSDLILTVTLENDEFLQSDFDFLVLNFPDEFMNGGESRGRKRRHSGGQQQKSAQQQTTDSMASSLLTKVKIKAVRDRLINTEIAKTYKLVPATRRCTFSVAFEREPIFIGGRYCKYSRMLPQSPWTSSSDAAMMADGQAFLTKPTSSVSEKVAGVMVKHFCADSSRFIASGREDIDVRMLGTGRPFAVQLLNARKTSALIPSLVASTMANLAAKINGADRDVSVAGLALVSAKQAQMLNVGQEEKRKTYSALCFSRLPLPSDDAAPFARLASLGCVEIAQKTVIRVLKRRPLIDRKRHIYAMSATRLDPYHFVLRLETQAGTYVKEFVHSDFGRTRPSLADLLGVPLGQLDILQLDVLGVDLEWPPLPPLKQIKKEEERMKN